MTHGSRAKSKTRDGSRPRRSTLDSLSRPPVIITTTQLDRPHASSSSRSPNARSVSPVQDDYRASDGQVYAQPASSVRSRSVARPYHHHAPAASEDRGRYRDRSDGHLSSRDLEAYRSSRPSVVYPSDPRHSMAAIDYGDDGYQYTNAGELVKYDLDQSKSRSGRSPRRRDSIDAGYYRPNVNYDADRRNFNVNMSHDLNRVRQAEGRGGPPPSTRGFDKLHRGYDSRDVPPTAPVPPSPTSAGPATQIEVPGSLAPRRARPLSLHQEGGLRSLHYDEYYRSREDERAMRDRDMDKDYDRRPDAASRYYDDGVTSRGFGIRTDSLAGPVETRDRRHDSNGDEKRRRFDDELLPIGSDKERDGNRRSRQAAVNGEPESRRDRSRISGSLASSLGALVSAVGLAPTSKQDKQDPESPDPRRRPSPPEERESAREARKEELRGQYPDRPLERKREAVRDREPIRDREPLPLRDSDMTAARDVFRNGDGRDREPLREPLREREIVKEKDSARDKGPARERDYVREREPVNEPGIALTESDRVRPASDFRTNGESARLPASDPDDTRGSSRRNRASNAFNPNDASDLKQLKEQLASMDATEKRREREPDKQPRARSPSPSPTPGKAPAANGSTRNSSREEILDDSRGRELVISPPRDKADGKPLKGILKQPKASFPEDENPVREGVAPHKEDKKLKEVPPGARWTKINRKIVNPEALTVGKERFEVREDFVIVLRVLSKEEIQAYAAATQVLRERRRRKNDGNKERDDERDRERERPVDDDDDEVENGERRHHRRRRRDSDEVDGEGGDKDRERHRDRDHHRDHARDDDRRRLHRGDDGFDGGDDYDVRYNADSDHYRHHHHHHHHHPRSFRERERELDGKE